MNAMYKNKILLDKFPYNIDTSEVIEFLEKESDKRSHREL